MLSYMGWNPWKAIGECVGLRLVLVDAPIPGSYWPDVNGEAVIVIDTRQPAAAEELAHHELALFPHADPVETARMELRARRRAANRLVSIEGLASALRCCDTWDDVAQHLNVDPALLEARLHGLDPSEADALRGLLKGQGTEL